MSEFEIKCPKCGALVTADDVIEKRMHEKEKLYKKKIETDIKEKLEKKDADLEQLQNSLADMQKTKKEEQDAIKKQAQLDAGRESKEEIDKVKKNSDIEKRRLQEKLDAMQEQLEQKSVEVQGEVQEELIEDFIAEKFPDDDLETIKKGVNGADSMLKIKSADGTLIGKILMESKNTKEFSQQWIQKLLKDMKNQNADVGLIITKALPKTDFPKDQGYKPYEGGLVCVVEFKYALVHILVEMIRNRIIDSKKNTNTENVPEELKKLWDIITGPQFITQFRLLYNNLKKVDAAAEKIDSTIRKQVANQQKHINEALEIQREMILNLVSKVGSESLPTKLIKFDGE